MQGGLRLIDEKKVRGLQLNIENMIKDYLLRERITLKPMGRRGTFHADPMERDVSGYIFFYHSLIFHLSRKWSRE